MILHLIANYNVKAGFFGDMVAMNIEPEVLAKDYIQIIANYPKDALEHLKECDVYCMGTYDNVSGVIVPCKEFLLHASEAVEKLIGSEEVKKEEKIDG